ncbi:MAG: hypothetical protein IPJ82_19865 [Lewinellaceae bacterium]|nr:hypothetical protein [Lewinellaceae bacterium]
MQAEIRRVTRQLFLNKLLSNAASEMPTATVKGFILLEISVLESELKDKLPRAANVSEQANLTYLLDRIRLYRENPGDFKPAPAPVVPPGQPIGCEDEWPDKK